MPPPDTAFAFETWLLRIRSLLRPSCFRARSPERNSASGSRAAMSPAARHRMSAGGVIDFSAGPVVGQFELSPASVICSASSFVASSAS